MSNRRKNEPKRFVHRVEDGLLEFAARSERFTVSIPWSGAIIWPESCMVCGAVPADCRYLVAVTRISSWSLAAGVEPPWHRRRLEAPVCAACRARCGRQTLRRRIFPPLLLVVTLLGGLALARMLQPTHPLASRIIQVASVLVSVGGAVVAALAIGWHINATAQRGEMRFEFRSLDRARALAEANGVPVVGSSGV
ncbi:MAG: hypothetical protein H6812_13525 [Phycisphaeraceae bacterium]|nr:hypothetical protein [Phycisphaerales bacterium]MCB9844258.1 hypothetical protein [Phycisphaeraceae bacterium]